MFRLPEPCKRDKYTVSTTAIALGAFLSMALPVGGTATSTPSVAAITPLTSLAQQADLKVSGATGEGAPREGAPRVNGPRNTQRHNSSNPLGNPLPKWPAGSKNYRLLGTTAFPEFLTSAAERITPSEASTDPRLIRDGHGWAFSKAFIAQVGSDPWALPGIGFPNIETHSARVVANYKPYHAVLDWVPAETGNEEWQPVPAVYCMGLTTEQIAKRAARHERQILSYAIEHGISASLVKAVITKESCFNTKAVSKAGAEGLMQLMPETARWLKVTDSSDVNQNLKAGIRYLSDLRKRFGTEELALAAYNAGPGNVERHGGIPPFAETQQYVKSVMAKYRRYAATSRFTNQQVSY